MQQETHLEPIVTVLVDIPRSAVERFVQLMQEARDDDGLDFVSAERFDIGSNVARFCLIVRTDQLGDCQSLMDVAIEEFGSGTVQRIRLGRHNFSNPIREGNLSELVPPRELPRAVNRQILRQRIR